jgi:hypothetical protein
MEEGGISLWNITYAIENDIYNFGDSRTMTEELLE